MSNRLVAVALLAALGSTTACTPGRAAIAAGAGTILLGGLSYAAGQPNTNCTYLSQCGFTNGVIDGVGDEINDSQRDLGIIMMIAGAGLVFVGLIAEGNRTEDTSGGTPMVTYTGEPSVAVVGAPGAYFDVPSETVDAQSDAASEAPVVHTATPAEMALRSRLENRLAIQASLTARRGNCVAAVATSERLAEVDPKLYAELVRRDTALANCLARSAAHP